MSNAAFVTRLPILLRPDPARVVIRPYAPGADPDHARGRRIVTRVMALDEKDVAAELMEVARDFAGRHRKVEPLFLQRYREVESEVGPTEPVSDARAMLIGAYFSHEYSYEAAALFNPSIVPHPNQSGLDIGATRFVLSLRAVGEGHVSSIAFRTGICGAGDVIALDPQLPRALVPSVQRPALTDATDDRLSLRRQNGCELSEMVIFPSTPNQRNGIEDLRLVQFTEDDGSLTWFGTYTAYSGQGIRQELLRTDDFCTLDLDPIRGAAADGKGLALFPRRIGGRYAALGRADNETISLLYSNDVRQWGDGRTIIEPRWPWEFVQIGNCGSPMEIAEGWLVITHGVGAMRNYAIGACLLDRNDPSRLLARMTTPLIRPDDAEREGYVPNVAYSCGAMIHGRTLVLPYAIADSYTTFATMPIDALLGAMA